MTVRLPHTLRSDALDNRERILDAARAAFAAEGMNVPMREIARRAGVGPATFYRHFPAKQTLATEAFTDQLCACRVIVAELARRARDAGHLRPDFVLDDLILMLMANDGIHATSPATRVAASSSTACRCRFRRRSFV